VSGQLCRVAEGLSYKDITIAHSHPPPSPQKSDTCCFYYCSTYYKQYLLQTCSRGGGAGGTMEDMCVCLLLQDLVQSCLHGGGGDMGGHVLRETTSRGLCGLDCPSRTSGKNSRYFHSLGYEMGNFQKLVFFHTQKKKILFHTVTNNFIP
jgi:hypothetical protein